VGAKLAYQIESLIEGESAFSLDLHLLEIAHANR
jgi:hypothetical protein